MAGAATAVEQADAVRFAAFLHERQYPADCRSTVGVLTRTGVRPDGRPYPGNYFYGLGLGSQMVSLKFNFARALLQGQVYHFPTSHYVNPLRCPSQSFACYFEPPTNCTLPTSGPGPAATAARAASAHGEVQTERLLWCFELPRRRLTNLAGLQAVHSQGWYHAQLSAFLFRGNGAMRSYREAILSRLAFNASRTRASSAAGAGGPHNGTCAAMHLRRTDKHKGRRKEDTCELQTAGGVDNKGFIFFARQFRTWAYWEAARPAARLRVFLGSEDKATFAAMPPLLAPALSYWIPGTEFVMEGFKDINNHNERLKRRYAALVSRMAAARAAGAAAVAAFEREPATLKDEGMALVLQILMMGECDALFGSFASNVAILVRDLQHAALLRRGVRPHVVDACGRPYCGCGASFCMKLEKRAGREPRRTYRTMVDAMHGDNRNAI